MFANVKLLQKSYLLHNITFMKYFIGFLLIGNVAFAQLNDNDYQLAYKEAVQLFANQELEQAKARLSPLTSSNYNNPIVPYAMYYHALVNYRIGDFYQSRVKLRDLNTRYPDWEKIDEAKYLYVLGNLQENYFDEAFNTAQSILDDSIKVDLSAAIAQFIKPVKSLELLKSLYEKFPTEKIIAEVLVQRIQEKPYNTRQELQLSDMLTNRFKLKDKTSSKKGSFDDIIAKTKDGFIDFGVMLPFDLKMGVNSANQYAYDLYLGMQIAAEEVNKEGELVKLYGFDIGKTKESFEALKSDEALENMDVFIGPLYPAANQVAEGYAMKNGIIQVHPLSNSRELITNTKTIFLAQSSFEMQAKTALEFILDKTKDKTTSIYYGKFKKDSLMAIAYKNEAVRLGFTIKEIRKFNTETSITANQKVGHVFFTGDIDFANKIIRALGIRKLSYSLLMSTSGSFDFDKISRSVLSKELYILNPEYVDFEKAEVVAFKKAYQVKMFMQPSYYAYLGYDILKYYTMMLKDGNEIFRLNMNDSYLINEGFTLAGFDYAGYSNENKRVPIVRFRDGNFVMENY